jgi:hypothetical protein
MKRKIPKRHGAGMLFTLLLALQFSGSADMRVKPHPFPVGPNPSSIVAVDLNGDEWPEIITADRGTLSDLREERPANDELSLLIAQGDLKYEKLHPSLKTDFGPYAIAVANIDAHKWPDILVASFHATRHRDLYLFLNLRDEGIFKPEFFGVESDVLGYKRQMDGDGVPIYHRPALTSLDVGDINGDGLRDVLATGWSSDVIVYFEGDAETSFKAPVLIDLPGAPFSIKIADFNHDAHLDFAVTLMENNEVAVWQGDGTGAFKEAERFASRGRLPHRLQVADINQDGQRDLVVSHKHTDDSVNIFYGTGKFAFGVSQEIMLGSDRNVLEEDIQDIAVGDFNGDGFPDIAAACFSSARVVVLSTDNSKNKPFLEFSEQSYVFKGGQPRALCTADFDRNGSLDIAVALWGLNSVGLLLNE